MSYRDPRAAEARRLRAEEGWSTNRIRAELKVGKTTLTEWLRDAPIPEWTLRPNAKDDLAEEARRMRDVGHTYDEIAASPGVSKSSVSLWVRNVSRSRVPNPGWSPRARRLRDETRRVRTAERDAQRESRRGQIAEWFEPVDERYLFATALVSYWCEGSKAKPWSDRSQGVQYVNSDPALIRPFLRFLERVPVDHGGPTFRIHMHESASEEAAKRFWATELAISVDGFAKTVWKRHNPKTVRKNVGEGYHGCLVVQVRRSTELYRYIEDATLALLDVMGRLQDGPVA